MVSALAPTEGGPWELMPGHCGTIAVGQPLTVMYHLALGLLLDYILFLQ